MLILDTSVLLAALDADERTHDACRSLLEEADEPLVIPSPVLPEVGYWAEERLGVDAMILLLDDVRRGAYVVEETSLDDVARIKVLLDRYRDLRVGFVDAAVLATRRAARGTQTGDARSPALRGDASAPRRRAPVAALRDGSNVSCARSSRASSAPSWPGTA